MLDIFKWFIKKTGSTDILFIYYILFVGKTSCRICALLKIISILTMRIQFVEIRNRVQNSAAASPNNGLSWPSLTFGSIERVLKWSYNGEDDAKTQSLHWIRESDRKVIIFWCSGLILTMILLDVQLRWDAVHIYGSCCCYCSPKTPVCVRKIKLVIANDSFIYYYYADGVMRAKHQ